MAVKANEIVCR